MKFFDSVWLVYCSAQYAVYQVNDLRIGENADMVFIITTHQVRLYLRLVSQLAAQLDHAVTAAAIEYAVLAGGVAIALAAVFSGTGVFDNLQTKLEAIIDNVADGS